MYVKSLTLKGFKSFADPVTLDLQPGVNVVVGPNGSGKSNVIDAVAWVLGAQGVRALRGAKMDDVIFAGTGGRAPLGRAEVSLTIDNSDKRINVDVSEIAITRTLFRSGDSEYALNGVACRLLDIQELLSDSGVGRQQHVIVSQGNLDAVLSARPEDRRMIIEEAAGVLKYRKRRERSQRRLDSTEGNLERLQDVVREVRQQLRPLQKQAEAAMRHEAVAGELKALRLHISGRDIEALQHRRQNVEGDRRQLVDRDRELRTELDESDDAVSAAEGELARSQSEALGDQVERLEGLFQRARGLSALMAERYRSLQRDLSASVSRDVLASLESDAENFRRELTQVTADRLAADHPFVELTQIETQLASDWLAFEERWGEGLPVASNEAAQIRGELSALGRTVDGLDQEIERRERRFADLHRQTDGLVSSAASRRSDAERATGQRTDLEATARDAATRSANAEAVYDDADQSFRNAEHRVSMARARAEALTAALDASRARSGVERLSGIPGIAGTLAELVHVDEGYQAAFEAAAGEAMAAVVVDSVDTAKSSLERLSEGDDNGAVLVLGHSHVAESQGHSSGSGDHSSGSADRGTAYGRAPDGSSAETLRDHVRGNAPAVDALLDRLLCCSVVVDGEWESAIELALQYPELMVVTARGDRFSQTGWGIGAGGTGVTKAGVQQANDELSAAEQVLHSAQAHYDSATIERDAARSSAEAAHSQIVENDRAISVAGTELERAESRVESLRSETETVGISLTEMRERLQAERTRRELLEARLPKLEAAEASGEERARVWREERGVLEERSASLRKERTDLEVRVNSLDERSEFLRGRLASLEERLGQHRVEVDSAADRRNRIEFAMNALSRLRDVIEPRVSMIETLLMEVRARRNRERDRQRTVVERLDGLRTGRSAIERELRDNSERRQQQELRSAEIELRLEAALEMLDRELGSDLESAIAAPEPSLPEGRTSKQRMAELDRELRNMGPINPLALEEFNAVTERHVFLDKQLQDVQESRRELVRVIRTVDAEIVQTFSDAYVDVARNFEQLFGTLFPSGSGNLRLTDPENPLETGIDIDAKPSGRNVRTLSLLSGGERSLAAMAFLFAVFRSRPSPFYLLDEVEAALDDVNLSRFLSLVNEFREEAQLVIVSHQKRTMEVADCLYGVSMQAGGSSKVVTERLELDLTQSA